MQEAYVGSTLRSCLSRSLLPCCCSIASSSGSESKWSSMARLVAPVMNTRRRAPAASASSTAYWMRGLSTTGSISLGLALVAGRKRVPRPATGNTAVRIAAPRAEVLMETSPGPCCWRRSLAAMPGRQHRKSGRPHRRVGALGPLEDRRPHAVPGVTLRAAPVPADAVQAAVVALVAPARIPDAREQRAEGARLGHRDHPGAELAGERRQARELLGRH